MDNRRFKPTAILMAFNDPIETIRHSNGLLLYNLYAELQHTIAHDVILPRLEGWEIERLDSLISESQRTFQREYDDLSNALRDDIELRANFEAYLRTLFLGNRTIAADANEPPTIEVILEARLQELKGVLDSIRQFFYKGRVVEHTTIREAASEQEYRRIISVAARLLWPVLFFRPPGERRCWTWPPHAGFVLNSLGATAKSRRSNTYLPTVLPEFPAPHGLDSLVPTIGVQAALQASHQAAGSGNDQEVELNEVLRLISGVSAFDDRVVADYYEIHREAQATRYDLLLGALSGLQLQVNGDETHHTPVGLLVLCSPLVRFFHELASAKRSDATILLQQAPAAYAAELSHDATIRQAWQRFGREVIVTARVVSEDAEDSGIRKLFEDCGSAFVSTNGPKVLHVIAGNYRAIEDRIELSRQSVRQIVAAPSRRSHRQPICEINWEEFFPGHSQVAKELRAQITHYAKTDIPVLLYGEKGSGKLYLAYAMQELRGHRRHRYECSSFTHPTDFDGVAPGTFTEVSGHAGLFEKLKGQTVFLDEIQDLILLGQRKLKTILDDHTVTRSGDLGTPIPVHFDLICATNQNLRPRIAQGAFLGDLFERIAGDELRVPSLNDRREDIPAYGRLFAENAHLEIARDALQFLDDVDYKWPGNIRELEHVVKKAAARTIHNSSNMITRDVVAIEFDNHKAKSLAVEQSEIGGIGGQVVDQDGQRHERQQSGTKQASMADITPVVSAPPSDKWEIKLQKQIEFLRKRQLWREPNERTPEWYDNVLERAREAVNGPNPDLTFDQLFKQGELEQYLLKFFGDGITKSTIWTHWMNGSDRWTEVIRKRSINAPGVRFIRKPGTMDHRGPKRLFFTEVNRVVNLTSQIT